MSIVKSEKFKDVLFQKMGNRWFVFMESSHKENEVLYHPLPEGINPQKDESLQFYEFIEKIAQKDSLRHDRSPKRGLDKSF